MADRVAVSNLVLSKLGETRKIVDPDEDSRQAIAIKRVWDATRDTALEAHLWNFALARKRLAASAAAPEWGWAYAFPLPEDFLRLDADAMEPAWLRGEERYRIEGGVLLCDHPGPVDIRYVRRVEAPPRWSPGFVEAFANLLAWQIADDITGDLARKDRCWKAWQESLPSAKNIDGVQNPPEAPEDSSWVTARYL